VGESSESTGGPAERLEPVSASNRVNFELLADYNPAAPMERGTERRLAKEKKQPSEKTTADGARVSRLAPPQSPRTAHPLPISSAPVPTAAAQSPIRPSYLGPGRHNSHSNFNSGPGFNPASKPSPMPRSSQGGLQ
jgi:hypothetical protein